MASSDSIIRNTFRQVTGGEADQTVLRAARNIPDNELATFFSSGGVQQFAQSPEAQIESVRQSVLEAFKPFEEAGKRAGRFDEENPFLFDEALARESAEERFDPFFQAELREFLTGINRQRGRTVQDEERLRQELTTQTEQFTGRARRQLDEALKGSREGFAGAGLFFSGERLRREGQLEQAGQEGVSDFLRKQGLRTEESGLRERRGLEDIGLRQQRGQRLQTAERETSLRGDVLGQEQEAQRLREVERQQFIGFPLATGRSTLNTVLGTG